MVGSAVKAFFDAFRAGDVGAALATLHDDLRVSEPAGLLAGGEYQGKEAFVGFLTATMQLYAVEIHNVTLLDTPTVTVALVDTTWTSTSTNRSLRTEFCELYETSDGLITSIKVFPRDTRALYELTVDD